jgi:hypothetical protein
MDTEHQDAFSDDRQAIISAAMSMIPAVVTLTGWRYINPSLIDGLLQSLAETRGIDPTRQMLGELEKELLDLAYPHQVEILKGPWLDALPNFVRRDVLGLCALHLLPFDAMDADVFRMVFRYRVCFTDQTDAALFRLNFG